MSDHNFERQVQQKMDELKLSPSATVWQGVEKSLDQNKRRRRGLIWIPILLMGLICGGVFTYQELIPASKSISSTQPETKSPSKKHTPLSNDASDLPNGDVADKNLHDIESIEQSQTNADTENVLQNQPGQKPATGNNQPDDQTVRNNNKPIVEEGQAVKIENSSDRTTIKRKSPAIADKLKKADFDSEEISENGLAVRTATIQALTSLNGPIQVLDVPSKSYDFMSELISSKGHPHITRSANSLEFGASLSGGMAGVNSGGIFNVFGSQVSDISMSAPLNSFSPSVSGGIVYKPSPIRPGFSYSVGAYVKKKLAPRLALSAGLNYTHFTASVDVGTQVNSLRIVNNGSRGFYNVNMYYTPGSSERITMNYQFIDLPLSVHYKLINSKRSPVFINGGLIASRLIKTDALHFDGSSGVYYRDNSLFNNYQLGVFSGFSVGLLNRSKTPVTIGPSFRYQVSNLLQKDVSGSKHILGASLDLRIALKK